MVKIYTKNGDEGSTTLIGGKKARKDAEIFGVLGTLDELNASLSFVDEKKIQSQLFELGALIANPTATSSDYSKLRNWAVSIEKRIDKVEEKLPRLKNFILPGGTQLAKQYHLCRSICRRFERELVHYYCLDEALNNGVKELALAYINRMSDLFFVLARYANFTEGVADDVWIGRKKKTS